MKEALGCGGQVSEEHLQEIEKALSSMHRTLPKNDHGRMERRSLRHLAHRYFNQMSALVVRGFEPSRPVSDSNWGNAEILSAQVPGFVESVLESRHATERGFDLRDAAYVVATIEQLIFDSEIVLLEKVYEEHHIDDERDDEDEHEHENTHDNEDDDNSDDDAADDHEEQNSHVHHVVDESTLREILEDYIVHWLMGDDEEGIKILLSNHSLLESTFPHWSQLRHFLLGRIKQLEYERRRSPMAVAKSHGKVGGNALLARYSFDDVHSIVGGITKSFASFWESECIEMKESLIAMDPLRTGRVPLSQFYGTGLDSEWRFGESEPYLRELGALDETGQHGKQVIIPNYIQAASNCIVTTSHYMVCCSNDCSPILSEIEVAIAASTAEPSQLLAVVQNMTSSSSLEDEVPVHIDASLSAQLESIAAAHGGQVPLHGRLFLQWLHYVFPRECPFPHKTGTVAQTAPHEYDGNYVATVEEMKAHKDADVKIDLPSDAALAKEEMQWMSQWSEEEELIAGYGEPSSGSWTTVCTAGGSVMFLLAAAVGTISFGRSKTDNPHFQLPTHRKAHFC
eukprot:TRINITY_DN91477_c0_g1_i1.p1 TRINITY_DN91477_c0_g1~~TRINITY_DN91477_c0_g1_i1.p1  ORF type:complete len:642 (+),score=135.09 TRINITY_DN91477_c0_g1_i1:225-1928(+)